MQQPKMNICEKHNKEIIVIDCSDDQQNNPLCLKCLAPFFKQQQMVTVGNAVETLSNIKQEFILNMEDQNNKNLEKIQTLLSEIMKSKTTLDQQYNKAINNLQSWISSIEEQNQVIKQHQLSTLNTKEFQQCLIQLQENNSSIVELKASLQQQFIKIGEDNTLQNSLKALDTIELIKQNTDCNLVQKQEICIEKYRTPNLKLICNQHETEIIMFDLNDRRNSEKRLACVYCQYDNKTYYTPIKVAEELWNQYQKQKNKQINELEDQGKCKINQLKSIFQSLGEVYQSTIEDIITYLDQILVDIYQLTNEHNQEFNKNWNQYTKEEIINIAETLSISQIQGLLELNIDIKLKEKDKYINKKINDQLQQINQYFIILKLNEKITQTNDKIKQIIYQNQVKDVQIIGLQQIEQIKVIQEDQEQQKTIKIINKDEIIKKDNQVIVIGEAEGFQRMVSKWAYIVMKYFHYVIQQCYVVKIFHNDNRVI